MGSWCVVRARQNSLAFFFDTSGAPTSRLKYCTNSGCGVEMQLLVLLAAGIASVSSASLNHRQNITPTSNSTSNAGNSSTSAPGAQTSQTSPPYYPSPWMDGSGGWEVAYSKAQAFVRQLTLLEKVNLTTGVGWEGEACVGNVGAIPRLNFPALCMQDSPLGVRDSDYNSAFPAGGTVAASWDRGVWYERGFGMGSEHRGKGVDVQLGPVVGPLGRSPEGGRNWEGFSPDPVLSGIAVANTIKGIQGAGVIACKFLSLQDGKLSTRIKNFPQV
jgi:hypothetical protein